MSGSLEWSGALGWAVEALVASTVLMVAVLALRGPARRAFGPDVAYALKYSFQSCVKLFFAIIPQFKRLSRLKDLALSSLNNTKVERALKA